MPKRKADSVVVEANPAILAACNHFIGCLNNRDEMDNYEKAASLAMALGRVMDLGHVDQEFVAGMVQLSFDMSRANAGVPN